MKKYNVWKWVALFAGVAGVGATLVPAESHAGWRGSVVFSSGYAAPCPPPPPRYCPPRIIYHPATVYAPPRIIYHPAPVYAPPRIIHRPAPTYYAPPEVIYPPAPVYYAPPRVVGAYFGSHRSKGCW